MKKKKIAEALNNIDVNMAGDANKKQTHMRTWRSWGVLAACLVLILGAAITLPAILEKNQSDVPVWDASHFPANEMLPPPGHSSNAYTDSLSLNPIPRDKYLNIYELTDVTAPKSDAQLQEFADATLPKLADALGISCPEYSIQKNAVHTDFAPYNINIAYHSKETRLVLSNSSGKGSQIVLNDIPLQIDLRLSDEEILASLKPIKKSLFKIFGASFSDVKIRRGSGISIIFYDENAHYLNKVFDTPVSDYISILYSPGSDENTFIGYTKLRVDLDALVPLVAKAKKLSLKDAEKLLKKGCVFNGICCLCEEEEEGIVFDSYDFVELEYWFAHDAKEYPTLGIPIYIFYKEVRTGHYAKACVPAIEIDGYEEYCKAQHEEHKHPSGYLSVFFLTL